MKILISDHFSSVYGEHAGISIVFDSVHIFEQDRSFLRDDLLAYDQTDPEGTFIIDWTAKQKDFWDDKIQVYAKFIGTENYTPAKSYVHKMRVLWYARDHLRK